MRKTICLLSALLMLAALALPVRADGYPMRLEELGITLTLPEGLTIYTREGPVDPSDALSPEDAQYLLDVMAENNIYLMATDPGPACEIQVRADSAPYEDISLLDDDLLELFMESLREKMELSGAEVNDLRVYRSSTMFLFTHHYFPEQDQYCHQYCTIKNNTVIFISLFSFGVPVTEEQAEAVRSIADSLREDDLPALKVPQPPLPSGFLYTEPESGTTVRVPEGWLRGYVGTDAKFTWSQDRSKAVVFDVTALPLAESPLKKMLGIRTDPLKHRSEEDLAEEFGVDPAQVTTLYLDGKKWFRISADMTAADFGQEGTAQSVLLMRSANGWQYRLQYLGTVEDPQYEDLEAMAASLDTPRSTIRSTPELEALKDVFHLLAVLLTLLVLLRWRKARRARKCPRCGRVGAKGASCCGSCGQKLP